MFNSTVLEVAIGLCFCYASVALIVSTIQEALASALRLRARGLLDGVKRMLNDPQFDGLARALYAHALINPQEDVHDASRDAVKSKPSYIEPRHFAQAMVDQLQTIPGNFIQLGRDIDALGDPQVRRVLQGMYQRANGELAAFQENLAGWFDSAMERVSGAYKRRALLVSLLLSLLLAILLNIDSIHLFRSLWQHPALAAHLSSGPAVLDQRALDALWSLPIGWTEFPPKMDDTLLMHVAGWLITSSTALFGAPFWFDLLQRAVQIRGTGAKPAPAATITVRSEAA